MNNSSNDGLAIMRAYVEGQARLGYTDFHPQPNHDDIILATFPKSGSTWMSYLLHQIRSSGSDNFDDIKNEVVDITPGHWPADEQPFAMRQNYQPRTYKTHGSYALAPKGARYIYVGRDPKDIFVSLYNFIHDLLGIEEKVAVDLFYREYFVERFDSEHDIGNVWSHILSWHQIYQKKNMLWLFYEDMLEFRRPSLKAIANHMGLNLNDALIKIVLAHSQMEHMRSIGQKINPSPDNYVGKIVAGFGDLTKNYARKMKFGKMRRGIPGDGKKDLPEEIRQELDKEWANRITPHMGYKNYQQMRAESSIFSSPQFAQIS